jgi:lauroyl/myristoyl acyltransferase
MDSTADPLRPRKSSAYAAMEDIKTFLNKKREPLWLLAAGKSEADVFHRLKEAEPVLTEAVSNNLIASFTLPTALWPDPEAQIANRPLAMDLVGRRDILRDAAQSNGFAPSALGLTEKILDTWQAVSAIHGTFWPTNPMSRWIFDKVTSRTSTNLFALGFINPVESGTHNAPSRLSTLEAALPQQDVWLSGWELLGSAIFSKVKSNLWKLVTPMVSLILLSLWLAFRRWQEVVLSIAVLFLSGLCLLSVMRLTHWSWNLLNLMALPLILGTGVDYSIFMQLALRRYHGDLQMAYNSVGRALLLCGATAIAGFGSLAWSSNAGMASLGQVCAVGIAGNMLGSIFLLPIWWKTIAGRGEERGVKGEGQRKDAPPSTPSFLYRADLWRIGLWFVRVLPETLLVQVLRAATGLYWFIARRRREVVIQNLLPALDGDRAAAERKARQLFRNFAVKLADLWRFEAGLTIDHLFGEAIGWEHIARAHEQKRGVLVLTPHLGNWEFGGPWLTRRGIPLQVITFAEPGQGFTELRREARARWNIETFVIGDDPFAFIEVIHKLEAGLTIALLVDRPPPSAAVTVELFGQPFAASIAVAELARASGCALVPVFIPRGNKNHSAHVLPPITYDRAGLRDRAARTQLTQQIIRVFEPAIRQHLDQWYHFVPVWTAQAKRSD